MPQAIQKIIPLEAVPAWRTQARNAGQRVICTNGCFDILHAGHVSYLQSARALGDLLLVGLNSDSSVRQLKGPERPVNPEQDRALVLAALEAVSAIAIFRDTRAAHFLELAQPDVYVKGGDLSVEQIPTEEREAVARAGGRILIMPHIPGRSTTALIQAIRKLG